MKKFTLIRVNGTINVNKQIHDKSIAFYSFLFALLFMLSFNGMAAVGLRGTTTANTLTGTLVIGKPAGLVAGDVMFAQILQSGTSTALAASTYTDATSTGWTFVANEQIRSEVGHYSRVTLLYKIATSADVSAPGFSFTIDAYASAGLGSISAFSGVDIANGVNVSGATGGPFDVSPLGLYQGKNNDNSLNANSVFTQSANAAVVMFGAMHGNVSVSTWATISVLTEIYDNVFDAPEDIAIGSAWTIQPSAGNSGSGSAVISAAAWNGATIVALKAAAPPTITSFTPTSGCIEGTNVIITGTNFINVSGVSFNGVPTTYAVNSTTQITALVPNGATNGPITVVAGAGSVTSTGSFTITGSPVLFSVTGGGSYVGTAGAPVGLSDSRNDTKYQLKRNGVNVGTQIQGTGAAFSFGNQLAGTYTVEAIDPVTLCSRMMNGNAIVTLVTNTYQVFTTTGNFTVPYGVSCIRVDAWGGGGGGSSFAGAAGGGGGGAYVAGILNVTGNTTVPVTVGTAGNVGGAGGASTVGSLTANGGSSSSTATGGTGGAASVTGGDVFIVSYAGGNGGNGIVNSGGGGGGGSAFYNLNGGNGTNAQADNSNTNNWGGKGGPGTGNGGRGSEEDGDTAAVAGVWPGGGGGGRGHITTTPQLGPSMIGAAGVVKISWTIHNTPSVTVCSGSTVSIVSTTTCDGPSVNTSGANGGTANLEWFTNVTGGSSIYSGSSLNPFTNTGATTAYPGIASGTPGTYSFYTQCSMIPGCRSQVNLVIVAQPTGPTLNVKSPNVTTVCRGTALSATITAGSGGAGCVDSLRYRLADTSPWIVYTSGTSISTTALTTTHVTIQGKRGGCTAGTGCTGTNWTALADWYVNEVNTLATAVKSPNLDNVCLETQVQATITPGTGGVGCSDSYRYSLAGINGPWAAYTSGNQLSISNPANADTIVIQAKRSGCTAGAGCDTIAWTTIAMWRVGIKPVFSTATGMVLNNSTVQGYSDLDACTDTVSYNVAVTGTWPAASTFTFKKRSGSYTGTIIAQGTGTGSGTVFNKGNTYMWVYATSSCNTKDSIRFTVNVTDTVPPKLVCPAEVTVPISGINCTADVPNLVTLVTATDNCPFNTPNGKPILTQEPTEFFGLANPSHNKLYDATVNVFDGSSTVALNHCVIKLRTIDVTRPKFTACPVPRNVNLNTECKLLVPDMRPELLGYDNCTSVTKSQVPAPGALLSSAHNQVHRIAMILTDANGLTDTCFVDLTGKDITTPVITACPQPRNLNLSTSCTVTIPDLKAGLIYTEACSATVTQFPAAGAIIASSHNQTHTVTLTVTDAAGLSASCNVVLTSKDVTLPVITTCPANQNVNLEGNCTLKIPNLVPLTVATDNCNVTITQSPVAGTFVSSGHNQTHVVTITATDLVGQTATCQVTLTGKDVTPPTVITQNVTVDLNASGEATVTAAQVNNNSTDNCGIRSYDLNKTKFFCNNSGINVVTLTVTDINGNIATKDAVVNVRELTPPIALCKAATIYLDNSGNATLNYNLVNNNSTDNCGIVSYVLDKTAFTCTNIGTNSVRMTVMDGSGNSAFCNTLVTVVDPVPIKLTCPADVNEVITNTACNLNLTIAKPVVTDNCLLTVLNSRNNTDNASGTYNVGITQVVWTVTDKMGNTETCRQNITIKATPVVNADVVSLDENASVVVNPLINDTDCENGIKPSTFTISVPPKRGIVSDINLATGSFKFTPTVNTYGKDSLRYTVCDNDGLCASNWVRITVKRINFAPDAVYDTYTTGNCRPFTFNVLTNDTDPDGDPLTKPTVVSNVTTGTLTQNSDGTFTYTPAAGFIGTDKFTYKVCDIPVTAYPDPYLCDQAEVTITVKQDTDCDAVVDDVDVDDDNDGITDEIETTADTDADGINNQFDIDSDGDGIVDIIEAQPNGAIREPKWSDKDGDGLDDMFDKDNGGTPIAVTFKDLVDSDGDGKPDFLDTDSDGDGMVDAIEAWDMGTDGKADIVPAKKDTDKDGLDDNYDSINGWKVTNNPLDKKSFRRDFDNDGKPDWRDADDDNDGKLTSSELNKPNALYPYDYDADGVWDYLDVDDSCDLLVPNGFSPDGDQFNQYFKIQCLHNYPNSKIQIYTRGGNLVYENKNYGVDNNWWDGTSSHSWTVGSSKVPPGTYIYILIVGNGDIKKGTIYVNY